MTWQTTLAAHERRVLYEMAHDLYTNWGRRYSDGKTRRRVAIDLDQESFIPEPYFGWFHMVEGEEQYPAFRKFTGRAFDDGVRAYFAEFHKMALTDDDVDAIRETLRHVRMDIILEKYGDEGVPVDKGIDPRSI